MEPEPWERPFPPQATEADIYYCFRLLLGRNPNKSEWEGHRGTMLGQPLAKLLGGYLDSVEFTRRPRQPAGDGTVAKIAWPDFDIFCDTEDPAIGRHVAAGVYEPEIVAVFRRLLRPGMGVIDIGANIGVFTLLAASIVGPTGYVLAVEPNGANARLLEASRRANGFSQVTVAQVAAGAAIGLLELRTSYSTGSTPALSADTAAILAAPTVPAIPADLLVEQGRRIHLLKLDTDGAEYIALHGCRGIIRRDRPFVVTEYSPELMPGISGVPPHTYLAALIAEGYELDLVETDGSTVPLGPNPAAADAALAGRHTDHIDILARPVTA